jgi:hypothetical protein
MFNRVATAAMLALMTIAAGCQAHSLTLDLTPNPVIVGLLDRQATIHARVVARGFGRIPMSSVQFAVFNERDSLIVSDSTTVDQTIAASPLGFVVDKDYTFPINGALVVATGTRYIMVKVLDPSGNVLTQSRLNIVVHALKGLPFPQVITTPTPR